MMDSGNYRGRLPALCSNNTSMASSFSGYPYLHSLDNMKVVFKEKSQIVLDILGQCEKSGQTIDIQKLFMQYTLDSFGRIGFGIEINSLTDDAVMFPHHFDRAQRILSDLLFNPLLKFTKVWNMRSTFLIIPDGGRFPRKREIHGRLYLQANRWPQGRNRSNVSIH